MMLALEVQDASTAATVPEAHRLQHWIGEALRAAGHRRPAEIVLRVVDSAEMSELNARFRGRTGPTNVLSFPAGLPEGLDLPLLGDLVICAPLVLSEARTQGKPERAHWAHLCVHGTLHLLGFDHQQAAEAERMEALETQILQGLGFACPYTGYPAAPDTAADTTADTPTTEEHSAS
jgi:probable rRNA maturation factor